MTGAENEKITLEITPSDLTTISEFYYLKGDSDTVGTIVNLDSSNKYLIELTEAAEYSFKYLTNGNNVTLSEK